MNDEEVYTTVRKVYPLEQSRRSSKTVDGTTSLYKNVLLGMLSTRFSTILQDRTSRHTRPSQPHLPRELFLLFFPAFPFPFCAVVLTFSSTSKSSAPELEDAISSSSSISDSAVFWLRKRPATRSYAQAGKRKRAVSRMVGCGNSLGWCC